MKIKRYDWEEDGSPVLPHLDTILQKFDKVIVVRDGTKIVGYSGYETYENRHIITSFWTIKDGAAAQKALLEELKKELNFNHQKRIGMEVKSDDEVLLAALTDCGWYVYLPDNEKQITLPIRACYQLSIPPGEIERLRNINEHKITKNGT